MGKLCAVVDCGKSTLIHKISLFKCPINDASIFQWNFFLEIVNQKYKDVLKPNETIYICSDHFQSDCIEKLPSGRFRLCKNSLPSLLNGEIKCTREGIEAAYKKKNSKLRDRLLDCENELLDLKEEQVCLQEQNEELAKLRLYLLDKDNTIRKLKTALEESEKLCISLRTKLDAKTAIISMYKQKEYAQIRKVKRSKHTLKRKNEQALLKNDAKRAKFKQENRLTDKALRILNELIARGQQASSTPYSNLLKEFAFEIHYYSNKAYHRLRDTFITLPNTGSLNRWTEHVKVKPGFLPDAFTFIKARVNESPHQMYYAIMADEVHIRQQIIAQGNGFIGYVEYGDMADNTFTDKEATAALFIMASEINGNHKIPLGYILTNGIKAKVLSQVLDRTIKKMNELRARVLSITFDGLPANLKAVEILGARLDILASDFKPYIWNSAMQSKIYIILDASHMIKLMQNLFKEYGTLVSESKEIKWDYLKKLSTLQDSEGLRAANKLTNRHTNYHNQKMKTKLAAQTLSGSCAIALRFVRELNMYGFAESESTEKFLHIMNNLFDYLNSSRYGVGTKAPLEMHKLQEVKNFFQQCKQYLLDLKWRRYSSGGTFFDLPLIQSPRHCAVKGLIITMTSLEMIVEDVLCEVSSSLKYLPTVKVSQDPLENFFSSLRARFGFNNNPNAAQLSYAIKGMLCMKTKPIQNGNCIEQEELSTKISALGNFRTIIEDNSLLSEDVEDEEAEMETALELTDFVSNIVTYIGGFVGKKLIKTLRCSSCILKLYPTENDMALINTDCTLTFYRDKGGLFYPSFILITVCKITEHFIRNNQSTGLRNMKKEGIANKVIHECLERGITQDLDCGATTLFEEGHAISLIKDIVASFCSTRFRHIARQATFKLKPLSKRNFLVKQIHRDGD